MKKYELLKSDTIKVKNSTLYRIRALADFDCVTKGSLGGYIEKEENLSHEGDCWIFNNAMVYNNARVYEYAQIHQNARIYGNARVYGNSLVYGCAIVFDKAKVFDNAYVFGNAEISGNAQVFGNAFVFGDAQVHQEASIFDCAWVEGSAEVWSNAQVYGNAYISDTAWVCDNGNVSSRNDIIYLSLFGSQFENFTIYKNTNGNLSIASMYFYGTLEEFEEKVEKMHADNESVKDYKAIIQLTKIHFNLI